MQDEELVAEFQQQGDIKAMDELFRRYKNLVQKKADHYFLRGGDKEDLIQEGMIGLFKAIRDYDGSKNARFRTFATTCIRGKILSAVQTDTRKKNEPLNNAYPLEKQGSTDNTDDPDRKGRDHLAEESAKDVDPVVEELIGAEESKEIAREIKAALTAKEKKVLQQYLQLKSHEEMAETLGCDKKSIDNAMQRVRKKLNKIGTAHGDVAKVKGLLRFIEAWGIC